MSDWADEEANTFVDQWYQHQEFARGHLGYEELHDLEQRIGRHLRQANREARTAALDEAAKKLKELAEAAHRDPDNLGDIALDNAADAILALKGGA